MALSPVGCVRRGVPVEAVAAFFDMTVEALEAEMQQAEDARQDAEVDLVRADLVRRGKLMTVLLEREELPGYRFRQTKK